MRVRAYEHVSAFECKNVRAGPYVCVCANQLMCPNACEGAHASTCMHRCVHVRVNVRVHVRVRVRVRIRVCVRVRVRERCSCAVYMRVSVCVCVRMQCACGVRVCGVQCANRRALPVPPLESVRR